MFEITPDEIAKLTDADLRDLVGLLCEATLRESRLQTSAVTYGGNQDASDGGLDVRVTLPNELKIFGFIPKPRTGFQVKKPDLKPSEIGPEMRPRGKLRPSIKELVDQSGAYVIVSSAANLTDKAYRDRLAAIDQALKRVKGAAKLSRDYYDRKRLTTWVRDHSGLIAWVKLRVGNAIKGWQPCGAWAYPAEGADAPYLLDEKVRILTDNRGATARLSIADGINRMRDALRGPAKVVRLVGLSGVGKTRLVQALFDSRVGENSLNPAHVFYTNMSDNPDPQPIGLASDLIASKVPAVIVVDNCAADLHHRLTDIVRKPGSTVSVITVEYDIRDEEHEGTEVFRVEPSSDDLIEKLVKSRFKNVSAVDASTIAGFSGGNARIAIALANTAGKKDRLTGMSDEDLFGRLFQQRHEHDAGLLQIAGACSLVYSFQAEALDGDAAELPFISAIVGRTVHQVHTAVAELERRDLIQRRGVWRAVLPHAIANRLAKRALQDIPEPIINKNLVQSTERFLKSFSRRLGYLDDSAEAVRIVDKWLAPGGVLSELGKLNELGHAMLANIAPLAAKSIVAALRRIPAEELSDRDRLARLVRSIAYDPVMFDDCVELLVAMARADLAKDQQCEAASCLVSLFAMLLSGTHASAEQRARACEKLLMSADPVVKRLGVDALEAALEALQFNSSYNFDFGSQSRDFGWRPETDNDVMNWFRQFLALLDQVRTNVPELSDQMKTLLARKFRGLYTCGGVADEVTALFDQIAQQDFWPDGWLAVGQTLSFDGARMLAQVRDKIKSLADRLRPIDLEQRVHAVVAGSSTAGLDFEDIEFDEDEDPKTAWERQDAIARELGKQVAEAGDLIDRLAPSLIRGQGLTSSFGRGLAQGADPRRIWSALKDCLGAIPQTEHRFDVFQGILCELQNQGSDLFEALLDEAMKDPVLGPVFPCLQSSVKIDARGVARLRECLALDLTPVQQFHCLAYGGTANPICPADLRDLLITLSAKPDGTGPAIDILAMRAFSLRQAGGPLPVELIDAGRVLLQRVRFERQRHHLADHELAKIIRLVFGLGGGKSAFKAVCMNLSAAVANNDIYAWDYDESVQALLTARPFEALDAFIGGTEDDIKTGLRILNKEISHNIEPLGTATVGDVIIWCDRDPLRRYPIIAKIIPLFDKDDDPAEWSEYAREVLHRAPDKMAALKCFVDRFHPRVWSGSLASIYEQRLPLLRKLETDPNPEFARFAQEQTRLFTDTINKTREWETKMDSDRNERFED